MMTDDTILKIARIQGGLGNQMFIYAFAQNYRSILYDKTMYDDVNCSRAFDLGKYNIDRNFASEEQINRCKHDIRFKNKLFSKRFRKLLHLNKYILDFSNIKTEKVCNLYQENLLNIRGNAYFDWFFQTYKYFDKYREKLLHDFALLEPLNEENLTMLHKIQEANSVAVHIRRGDYTTPKCQLELLDLDYYNKAFEIIKNKVSEPHFFIFSNDVDWVSENIKTGASQTIVDINDESHGYFDLELMRNCKHDIIANSSFSWWGAWLNDNPYKIVIAPQKWFKPKREESSEDMIPESWIKI